MSERTHVIKRDAARATGVQAAASEEALPQSPARQGAGRIPAERVRAKPAQDGEAPRRPRHHAPILRGDQTRRADGPVQVEAQTFVPGLALADEAGHASQEAEAAPEEEPEPERSEEEWEALLEEAVAEARAEGYEEGHAAGVEEAEAAARAEHAEEKQALIGDIDRLETHWADYVERSEPMLVELALNLAETIADAPLAEKARAASEEALSDAVARLAGAPPVTVTVHPVDYLRLEESGLAEGLAQSHAGDLRWASDPDYAEGDWSVTSPGGAVRRLRRDVMDALRDRLELASDDGSTSESDTSEGDPSESNADSSAAGDPA